MATDIATLGIKIDSSSAAEASAKLDDMVRSGAAAEKQTIQLSRAAQMLNATHTRVNDIAGRTSGALKLTANEALNLSRQFADVGVTAAMGMSPFMILVQQGPQIYDIMQTSGLSVKGLGLELLRMVGIVRRVETQYHDLTVSATATAAAQAELASATRALNAAQLQLHLGSTLARDKLALQAAETRVAAAEAEVLAAAQAGVGTSARMMITGLAGTIAFVSAAAAGVAGVIAISWREMRDQVGDVTKGLNLTEDQLERVKKKGIDTSVTMGDYFKAFFQTIEGRFSKAFEDELKAAKGWFDWFWDALVQGFLFATKEAIAPFVTGYYMIRDTWSLLPAAFKDIGTQAANGFLEVIERMVNSASGLLNKVLPDDMKIGQVAFGRLNNPNQGAANKTAQILVGSSTRARADIDAGFAGFWEEMQGNARRNAEGRVMEGAGKAKDAGKSEAEKEYERLVKQSEQFIKGLREETAEIGKNRIEVKMMAAARAEAVAPTQKLKQEIREAADAWKEATISQAIKDFKRDLKDQAEAMQFESSLITMNTKEREIAIAMRELEMRVRDMAREGIIISAAEIEKETKAIRDNAEARGQRKLDSENLKDYTERVKEMNAALREGFSGAGDLFGPIGEGLESLINVYTNYADRRVELEERIAEATRRGSAGDLERQRAQEELARITIANYGNMLGAAKDFFDKGSAGYRVLQAAEGVYRVYQMATTAIKIANTVKEMAIDTAYTATSVANSGVRSTSYGIEAVAKAIASLPFPLNLAAGAATIAALVAVGVKLAGGGGGAATSVAAASTSANDNGLESSAMRSPYSTLPGRNGLYDPAHAGYDGSAPLASPNGSPGVSIVYSPTINAEGAEAGVLPALQTMLRESQQETLAMAREQAAADNINLNNRQRIGGR